MWVYIGSNPQSNEGLIMEVFHAQLFLLKIKWILLYYMLNNMAGKLNGYEPATRSRTT